MKKILIDQDNNAERFWGEVQDRAERGEAFAVLLSGLDLTSPLYLEDDEAEELWAYAQQVPGWADGPEHAREALLVQNLPGCKAVAVELRPEAEWAEDGMGTYQPHRDGRERLLLEAGAEVEARLDEDERVEGYREVTIYEDQVPGSRPVDCSNGVVAFVSDPYL